MELFIQSSKDEARSEAAKMAKEDLTRFQKVALKYGAPTSGLLKVKVKELIDQESQLIYPEHVQGRPGLMTGRAEPGTADQVKKKYIDFDTKMDEAGKKAEEIYDKAMMIFGHLPENESWDSLRDRLLAEGKTISEVRTEYDEQERPKALAKWIQNNVKDETFGFFGPKADDFLCTREEYVEQARVSSISTYAIVKDGKWFSRGEMGWFGMSDDSTSKADWNKQYLQMIEELTDDTLLTVVDCHI